MNTKNRKATKNTKNQDRMERLEKVTATIRKLHDDVRNSTLAKRELVGLQAEVHDLLVAVRGLEHTCLYGPIPWPWSANTTPERLPQTRRPGAFLESLPGDTESQKG